MEGDFVFSSGIEVEISLHTSVSAAASNFCETEQVPHSWQRERLVSEGTRIEFEGVAGGHRDCQGNFSTEKHTNLWKRLVVKLEYAVAGKPGVIPGRNRKNSNRVVVSLACSRAKVLSYSQFFTAISLSLFRKNAKWHKNKHQICLNASISEMSWDEPDPRDNSYQHCCCCNHTTRDFF